MAKQQKRKVSLESSMANAPVVTRASSSAEFDPDYTYVIENLRQIGTLAVIFIACLVVLSFIL